MTQAEAARCLGMTERGYRHLEYGTRNPSHETVQRVNEVFGLSYEDLMYNVPTKNRRRRGDAIA
ncbi:transcriptional regulator, XRE family [Alicyclobacillus acidocaldarius subsp. acidocaldarius Tc-4-1]|uniref:Transcriptional regulator, XRE family n=2 Tax=Alicyclobacillus acidocaldarius TaxID=405212 RepID=F8IHD9_ALIAT|nr:transcriptional regulator, XRE family [Alicyclobacillus acidocaldarius subsp. acidocaldarius Tc-4-1]